MKQRILAAVSVFATFLVGCATTNVVVSSPTVTAITHRPEDQSLQRSVGLLRRLAILPLQLDFTPQNPERCALPCNWEGWRRGLANNVMDYLSTRRGYEVVTLDPLAPSHVAVDLTDGELQERVSRLAIFASRRSTDPPPEELAVMVRDLGTRAGVDGIVILHGSTTTLTWMEVAAAFPLALSGYGLLPSRLRWLASEPSSRRTSSKLRPGDWFGLRSSALIASHPYLLQQSRRSSTRSNRPCLPCSRDRAPD
jgi:hypothetical protein